MQVTEPHTADLPQDVLDLATGFEQAFVRLARSILRPPTGELSRTAASILDWIDRTEPRRITELAEREAVAQPTMTGLVQRLEGQGLVERHPDSEDARAVRVSITRAGRALLRRRRAARAQRVGARLQRLNQGERAALEAALPVLRRLADDHEERS